MQHDRLVLTLLWREVLGGMRAMRRRDLAWIVLGGSALLAYAIADIVVGLHAAAATLRQAWTLWIFGLPATLLCLGGLAGSAVAGLSLSRAFAPFLKALPLSLRERRRMAGVATFSIGTPLAVTAAVAVGLVCAAIAKPSAPAWGLGAAILFTMGFGAAAGWRLRSSLDPIHFGASASPDEADGHRPSLRHFDRSKPAWLSSWAWGLPSGHLRLSWRMIGTAVLLSLAAGLAAATSLVHHDAAPAALVGAAGGLLVFMLSARFHPLGSPVLRTAPIGFTRTWLRLLRLPLQLSVAFFVLPAGAALAAEPSAWAMPVASGLWLLILNGAYAVFAAYFMSAPFVAALSFFGAVAYTGYESLEYGRTVLFGFAALVLWLWHSAYRRYRHG